MRVICIQDTHNGKKLLLEVGAIYTASQCPVYPDNYDLAEIPTFMGRPASYRKSFFAPLSDIDETELIRERQKQLVNQ